MAQDDTVSSKDKCKDLIVKAIKANGMDKPVEALKYLLEAQIIAEKNQLIDKLLPIKTNIGNSYSNLSSYGEALGLHQEVLKLARIQDNKEYELVSLNNIGTIYLKKHDYRTALGYLQDAYKIAESTDTYMKVVLAINIADTYTKIGEPDRAMMYLDAVRKEEKKKLFAQVWTVNYAEALFRKGEIDKAKDIMDNLYNEPQHGDVNCYTCMVGLLTKIYAAKNKTSEAIKYANMGLRATIDLDDRINLYKEIASIYEMHNDFKKVSQYKDSISIAKDSVSMLNSKGIYEANQVKFKVQEYQNQLQMNKEKQVKERNGFIFALVFGLLFFLFIYRSLRNRIVKQRQAQIIADNEKKIYSLELENLKNNIAERNRKLSAKALYLSGRNELIYDVISSISAIPEVIGKKEVADYIKNLKAYIKTDEEWDDFINYFEQVNPEFIKTLTNDYPELNASDIRFICYIYMNLDLREIGNIFNITYNAAVKRHRRIKEKMKIDTEKSISEYLMQKFKNQ